MPPDRTWIEQIADTLLAHRGKVLVAVLLVTAAFGYASRDLSLSTSPETLLETDDPELAHLRAHEGELGSFEHRVLLVVEAESVFQPTSLRRIARATESIRALPVAARVRSLTHSGFPLPDFEADLEAFRVRATTNSLVTPFLVSEDGRTTSIQVDLTTEADTPGRRDEAIGSILEAANDAGLDPAVTGIPAIRRTYADYIWTSVIYLPPIEIVVLGFLLIFAIRRVLPLFALLGVICFAALWTVGVIALTGGRVTALTSIIPPLIMVVGIAGGIHVVARFLEERGRGADPKSAARNAFVDMAIPCGLTSLTTAVGFSSLLIAGIRDVREFGIYSAAGALLTFLMGLPVMTVVLSWLGERSRERASRGLPVGRPLAWTARLVSRRPLLGVAVGVGLVAAAVPGILMLENETYLLEDIREEAPIQAATRLVDEKLGGVIGFDLLVESPDGALSPAVLPWLVRLEDRLRNLEGVRGVLGPGTLLEEVSNSLGADLDPGAAPFLLDMVGSQGGADIVSALYDPGRRSARIAVRTGDVGSRRSREIQSAVAALAEEERPPGAVTRIAGLHVLAETVLARLVAEMAKSTLLAFVVVLLLMTLIHRSIRIGLLSMVPNFLPLVVAAGFMGYAGITIRSSMALIFAVALGIAVDDTIHILHEYRCGLRGGLARTRAISSAILRTGRPVVLSSVVLIVGFLCYLLMGFKATQQFGMVAAVTIAAALVGDLLLLPAMLHLGARRRKG